MPEPESDPAPNLNSPSACLCICGLLFVVLQAVPPGCKTIPPARLNCPVAERVVPLKVKFDSPTKLVPLPPVITLLFALFDNVAEPVAP